MKNFKTFISEAKKCPPGKYYCFTDKKCKKIPTGYRVGYGGRLAPDILVFLHVTATYTTEELKLQTSCNSDITYFPETLMGLFFCLNTYKTIRR